MRSTIAALAIIVASPVANVPTGYQVQGCSAYRLVNGTVQQVCPETRTPEDWLRGTVTPGDPAYTGSAGESASATK